MNWVDINYLKTTFQKVLAAKSFLNKKFVLIQYLEIYRDGQNKPKTHKSWLSYNFNA